MGAPTTGRPGAARAAWRRLGTARAGLAVYAFGWLVATLLGGLPAALALERLARNLPGGTGDLAQPGGLLAFEALIDGMRSLGWAGSLALGIGLAWGVAAEPFLRGALLCRLADGCGAECGPRRGTLVRGARHLLRLLLLQVALWATLAGAAVALLQAGPAAALAVPPLWLAVSVVHDVAAVALVGAPTIRAGLATWAAAFRRRAAALLATGLALRLAAHLPLAVLALVVAGGPDGSPLRPLLLFALPLATLFVRAGWWALATELTRRAAGANFRENPPAELDKAPDVG